MSTFELVPNPILLNNDTISEIISHLDIFEFNKCSQLNKHFNHYINNVKLKGLIPYIWKDNYETTLRRFHHIMKIREGKPLLVRDYKSDVVIDCINNAYLQGVEQLDIKHNELVNLLKTMIFPYDSKDKNDKQIIAFTCPSLQTELIFDMMKIFKNKYNLCQKVNDLLDFPIDNPGDEMIYPCHSIELIRNLLKKSYNKRMLVLLNPIPPGPWKRYYQVDGIIPKDLMDKVLVLDYGKVSNNNQLFYSANDNLLDKLFTYILTYHKN